VRYNSSGSVHGIAISTKGGIMKKYSTFQKSISALLFLFLVALPFTVGAKITSQGKANKKTPAQVIHNKTLLAPVYDSWNTDIIGFWPSANVTALAARNDTIFMAFNDLVTIIDLSNISSPMILGNHEESEEIVDIIVDGNILFILMDGYISSVDISTPSNPDVLQEFSISKITSNFYLYNNRIYTIGYDGIAVIDVSNPSAMSEIGSFDESFYPEGITVNGNYAYIADQDSGLVVVDISNPSSMSKVGQCLIPEIPMEVAVNGNYAYIASSSGGLIVCDISNPANPVKVGSKALSEEAPDITIVGDYVYLSNYTDGIKVFDVSTPSSPVELLTIPTEEYANRMALTGSSLFVASTREGIIKLDVSTPSSPAKEGLYGFGENMWALDVSGNYVYTADRGFYFRIVDVTNIVNPTEVGRAVIGPNCQDITISGNYAYITENNGLRIFNCTDPTSPFEETFYQPTVWSGKIIEISNNYAYIANRSNGLLILDSTPSGPSANWITVSGNYVYIAASSDGLKIFDISDPASPVEKGTVDTGGMAVGIDVIGNLAIVADYYNGMKIIDCSDPTNPNIVGTFTATDNAKYVTVAGNRAFLIDGSHTMRVIDISDPSNPVEVGNFVSYGFMPSPPVVINDLAYQADMSYGLGIIDCSNAVETLLQSLSVTTGSNAVEIQWRVSSVEELREFVLFRSSSAEGKKRIASIPVESTRDYIYIDTDVKNGFEYIYELYAIAIDGFVIELGSKELTYKNTPGVMLSQNFPNPFNPITTITFTLPVESIVTLSVYDISGHLVKTPFTGKAGPGETRVIWDGTNSMGNPVASGVYIYKLTAGKKVLSRRMVLLR